MELINQDSIILEQEGININNERSLHSSIKRWYYQKGDRLEAKIDSFIIDIVRGNQLIEIQTKNFSALGRKLRALTKKHPVRLVHPIAKEKYIVKVSHENNKVISRRKSPKNGKVTDVFNELIRIPDLMSHENFTLEVLLIKEEEIRCDDGQGSWRRKGVSIKDRKLVDVIETVEFKDNSDFLALLPPDLQEPFSNKDLALKASVTISSARKITYCLRKMKVIEEFGKRKNELLFKISS